MRIARTLEALEWELARLDSAGAPARVTEPRRHALIGFVPTMGALHEGHLSLVAAARAECEAVVASIFVNPAQFGPGEDLARYPRDETDDLAKLRDAGCALVWLPDIGTMYPSGGTTQVVPGGPALGWEGVQRPGHFAGVATVVTKLFGQIRPQRAYFGEKDWQQLQVVRRMVADLNLSVQVVGVPTRRDPDGLALSSRNRFLSPAERAQAPRLAATLRAAAAELSALAGKAPVRGAGDASRTAAAVLRQARSDLTDAGFAVEYLALVDPQSLREVDEPGPGGFADLRLVAAARLRTVRLLDTMAIARQG